LTERTLTADDIILIRQKLDATQHLNRLLTDAIFKIEEAVIGIDPTSVQDRVAGAALEKVKNTISILEQEVERFNRTLK
jgi:hypothetical protein